MAFATLLAILLASEIAVDPSAEVGTIKPIHGVNNGPSTPKRTQAQSNFEAYRAARIPFARTHDAALNIGYGGSHVGDVSAIFPDFDKPVDDPASYDFAFTDRYLGTMVKAGTEPYFRLGQSIEHGVRKYHVGPPKDFLRWAQVCERIILHYTEGWADGFRWNIRHWEIWNEPDNNNPENPTCWGGTDEQFLDFYETVAKYLKTRFPGLRIGGPAFAGFRPRARRFVEEQAKRGTPMDFFSWHCYTTDPHEPAEKAAEVRRWLDDHGYTKTESHLTEWNYVRGWGAEWAYTLRVESGDLRSKGAAFIAAYLTELQRSPVELACYYDARLGTQMNGLFDIRGLKPMQGYYPVYAWSKLLRLGRQVAVTIRPGEGEKADLFAVAAKGTDGKVGLYLARFNDDDRVCTTERVTLRVPADAAVAHLADRTFLYSEMELAADERGEWTLELEPNAFAYVEFTGGTK